MEQKKPFIVTRCREGQAVVYRVRGERRTALGWYVGRNAVGFWCRVAGEGGQPTARLALADEIWLVEEEE